MLSLFPIEYWLLLFIVALTRVISGQLLHRRLRALQADNRYKEIIKTVSSPQFKAFLRFNGIAHMIVLLGLAFMFYMTYTYIVPITFNSLRTLRIVQLVGNVLIAVEMVNAAIAIALTLYLMRQK